MWYSGVAMCIRYPQPMLEFLGHLEAFLMNANHSTMTLELLGQFEQHLHKESQQVRKDTPQKCLCIYFKSVCDFLQAKNKAVVLKKENVAKVL